MYFTITLPEDTNCLVYEYITSFKFLKGLIIFQFSRYVVFILTLED
jgi:hypothetical protein